MAEPTDGGTFLGSGGAYDFFLPNVPLPPDDAGNVFLAELQVADTQSTLARLKALTEEPQAGAATGRGARTLSELIVGPGNAPQKEEDQRPLLQRVIEGAAAAAKDIGRGATQAPVQVVGGAADAAKELATSAEHMADWLQSKVPLKIPVPIGAVRNAAAGVIGPAAMLPTDETINGWLENPAAMIRDLMPDIGRRDTVTANLVRDTAQFVAAMYLSSRALGAFGASTGGTVGMAASGAIADFAMRNPDSGRLADLLSRQPALQGPVVDFLKSDPDDSEGLKRFKNALEGLALGTVGQGLIEGVKLVRAQLRTQKGAVEAFAKDPLAEARATYGEMKPSDLGLGDLNRPLVTTVKLDQGDKLRQAGRARAAMKATESGVPDDVVAKGISGPAKVGEVGERGIYVNYSRIDTPDDVKSVIDQVAEAFKGKIDAARRGAQTNRETQALADSLGMTVDDILSRRPGAPLNAEQALAARQVMNATAERLVEAAKVAASPNATPADLFAFRKLLAVHTAVQTEVIAARTETARALQAWSIPSKAGNVEMSRHVQSMLESAGTDTQQIAQRLAILQASGATPAGINGFIRASVLARTGEALKAAWIAGLLSNPKTHLVNATSNALTLMQQVYERRVAEGISALRGDGAIAPGEALAMLHGMTQSSGDALKAAAQAIRTGESSLAFMATPKVDAVARPISGEALGIGNDALSRGVDYLGKVFDVPGRLLGASDDFFKTIGYRMELHAQALRTAAAEGLTGEKAAARINQILLNPPENIRLSAVDAALYNTFTNRPGPMGQALLALRAKVPATTVILPFIKTPANIASYAFERSPLAPLTASWRADMAAGGARQDLALARMATGTMIMMTALDLADQGVITGSGVYSKNESAKKGTEQRLGWQPYSVKVGDKYYSYQRADPFGMTLGFAADFAEMFKRGELEGDKMDEAEEILAAGIAAISNATISKTYLRGASEFFSTMGDPAQASKRYVGQLMGSAVPAAVNVARQVEDPVSRETMRIWDYVTNRLPVYASTLPARRNLWGEIEPDRSGLGEGTNVMSPVQISQQKGEPIDLEMRRLNVGQDRIKQKVDWDGVPVNFADWPRVYEAYVRLAGNDLVHPAWGLGAKDYLNAVVSGTHPMSEVYRLAGDSEEGKGAFIRNAVSQYRQLARATIMADPRFQDFAEFIRQEKEAKRGRRLTFR